MALDQFSREALRSVVAQVLDIQECQVRQLEKDADKNGVYNKTISALLNTKQAALEAKEVHRLNKEQATEAARVQEVLSFAGIKPMDLSPSAQNDLGLLAGTAGRLCLHSARPLDILAAWTQLAAQHSREQILESQLEEEEAQIDRDTELARCRLADIRRTQQQLRLAQESSGADLEKGRTKLAALPDGIRKDQDKMDAANRSLQRAEYSPEIEQHSILTLSRQLHDIDLHRQQLAAELQRYHNLPPSLIGAEAILAKTVSELRRLEAMMAQQLRDDLA